MWRRTLFWQLILAAANGLLLLGLISVWWEPEGTPAPVRPGKESQVPKAPHLRDQQPLSAFQMVTAKNLFSPDRKGPEEQTASKPKESLEGHKLLGTIIIGDEKAAIISAPQGTGPRPPAKAAAQNILVVRRGDDCGGYKIVDISNEEVIFQGKEGKKTLNFPE